LFLCQDFIFWRYSARIRSMKKEIAKIVKKAILDLQKTGDFRVLETPEIVVEHPSVEKFGDYTTNIAMVLGKLLKKNPLEIAEALKLGFKDLKKPSFENTFEKVEVITPGYINFYLSQKYLGGIVAEINKQKESFGNSEIGKGEKIHLDFVSANPTGPVTLGNGRGGTLGDTLANILEKSGYKPWREYYVNDFGNQIKVLGHSILKDEEAQYKGEYINELSKKVSGTDPFEVGQAAAKIILEEIIKPSMQKMGIAFDNYFLEKSLHDSGEVENIFKDFFAKDFFYESDGAVWFRAEKFGDEKDRVVRKSTGEVTYFGGDIAYHKNKFERGFSRAIDVWGADHHGDVKRVMGAVEALGYVGKLEIVINQLLKVIKDGKEFRMSKRKGTYVSVDDLLEEVGKDAVRFFFLMYSPDTHMTFDLDLAKERSEKNPVFYVQYAHARICSILRKIESVKVGADLGLLAHEKELSLIKELNKFPELVEEIAKNYEVHALPHYAIKLADKFHSFYNACKVIDVENPEMTNARLNLVNAVRIVLAETLRLIGVSAPERM
jgi:arginyl-tRNA synthetase